MIAKDCETTGVDFHHGALPFFFTFCDEAGEQLWWEADVDPVTRKPLWTSEDLAEIEEYGNLHSEWIYQNCKFDLKAEKVVGIRHPDDAWDRVQDTLIAAHLLASNQPHDLTSLALQYLGANIEPLEKDLATAVHDARKLCRKECPTWRLAKEGLPEMPSAKQTVWKADYWLPRTVCQVFGWPESHPWQTVLSKYANSDSATTMILWKVMRAEIERRGLWAIYKERMRLLPVAYEMETRGVTLSGDRLEELLAEYGEESEQAAFRCLSTAASYGVDLALSGDGSQGSLKSLLFDKLCLPPLKKSKKTGEPSIDKSVIEGWEQSLDGKPLEFIQAFAAKRKRDTACSYLEGYKRFWLPMESVADGWYVLHPNLNECGTDTLRWSSSHPNSQNISKKESFNLRRCFGPAPGREWWSLDAQNIELRIPAFKAGETELMDVFLEPDKPPYYGSYHLAIFDVLHPDLFRQHGTKCKSLYESTLYQWVKNGNFAVLYGAGEETADRAYHVAGAHARIKHRFPKMAELSSRMEASAKRLGRVETIPDRSVDPDKGYPILVGRGAWGQVKPTTTLNYFVQGSACWWMGRAMVRCQPQLQEWGDAWMVLQVHDELVFDFPMGKGKPSWKSNLPRIRTLQRLMELGGKDIGVLTPVAIEYHDRDWSTGQVLC